MLSRRFLRRVLVVLLLAAAGAYGVEKWRSEHPTNHRDWIVPHLIPAAAAVVNDSAYIADIRNFDYTAENRFAPAYYDAAFDLDKLESAWFVLTPFSDWWRGPAHSFVSFGFSDSQFVAISVEARRERGETYSPLRGAIKQYELIYVIGSERDLIGQRAMFGDYPVYLYPIRAPRERIRAVFVEMLRRANELRDAPEFYNTVTNNCTSNVVRHVNQAAPGRIPGGLKTALPGYTDEVALRLGLIDTDSDLESMRDRFRVNERAQFYYDDPSFSLRIREPGEIEPAFRSRRVAAEAAPR